jgi:hypothetical protein
MSPRLHTLPCPGFPVPLVYPDVDAETLAREAAAEQKAPAPAWPNRLCRGAKADDAAA